MGRLQTPQNYVVVSNHITGERTELPCFTCVHCQRVVVMRPDRTCERQVCRKCDALVCDYCLRECTPILADAEKAGADLYKQPWLLRDHGEPMRRVLDAEGKPILAKAKDVSYTDREMANLAGELNYDGTAKRKAGEQVL